MSTWMVYPSDSDVLHYGVKGMKWKNKKATTPREAEQISEKMMTAAIMGAYVPDIKSANTKSNAKTKQKANTEKIKARAKEKAVNLAYNSLRAKYGKISKSDIRVESIQINAKTGIATVAIETKKGTSMKIKVRY